MGRIDLEDNDEFLGWLKNAVRNCKRKNFEEINDKDFFPKKEHGTSGYVRFKGEAKTELLTFGTFWTNEYADAARIYVWFYIGRESDREPVSLALEKKLYYLEENWKRLQKEGDYIYVSNIKHYSGDMFFYLDEKYFQEIVSDDVPLERKQKILSGFFDEVMSLV